MHDNYEGPHFVGRLGVLASRLESAALFAQNSGVQLTVVGSEVVVAAGRPQHTIAHTMPALRASGSLWISDFIELLDTIRATIGERSHLLTQDRRFYTLIAADDRHAELSIDGCEPILLRATRQAVIADPTAVAPTCATVHHADLMHAWRRCGFRATESR